MSSSNKFRALASACRSLAVELEAGNGPKLDKMAAITYGAPCCVFGHAVVRAGLDAAGPGNLYIETNYDALLKYFNNDVFIDTELRSSLMDLGNTNDRATECLRAEAVLPPLKRLADIFDRRAADEPNTCSSSSSSLQLPSG